MKSSLFLLVVLLAGCSAFADPPRHTDRPGVQIEVMDESLQPYAAMWQREISRRFPSAVGILCHGGDFVEGEWVVGCAHGSHQLIRAADLVREVKGKYPGRAVVLLACNPGHLKLEVPGVYYSNSSVWCVPDRQQSSHATAANLTLNGKWISAAGDRSSEEPEVVGSIYEFESE